LPTNINTGDGAFVQCAAPLLPRPVLLLAFSRIMSHQRYRDLDRGWLLLRSQLVVVEKNKRPLKGLFFLFLNHEGGYIPKVFIIIFYGLGLFCLQSGLCFSHVFGRLEVFVGLLFVIDVQINVIFFLV
jgi:hypothetical protein